MYSDNKLNYLTSSIRRYNRSQSLRITTRKLYSHKMLKISTFLTLRWWCFMTNLRNLLWVALYFYWELIMKPTINFSSVSNVYVTSFRRRYKKNYITALQWFNNGLNRFLFRHLRLRFTRIITWLISSPVSFNVP